MRNGVGGVGSGLGLRVFGKYGDVLVIFRLSVDVWLFHVFLGLFFLLLLEALECLSHFILGKKPRKGVSVADSAFL